MATWQVSEVQKYLKGAEYPSSGGDLAKLAKGNGAEDELVERLSSISRAEGPNDVMKELKGELGGPTPGGGQDRSPRDIDGPAWAVDEVQGHLKGASYPASGDDLAKLAKSNGAEDELVEALSGLGTVDAPTDVMRKLKDSLGGEEGRSGG